MKHILIMAAEQEELDAAAAAYNGVRSQTESSLSIKFMLCGIGVTSATYAITKEIYRAAAAGVRYNMAILVGLAGSYCLQKFPLGSIALINRAYLGDLGFDTPAGLRTLFDTKVLDSNIFPFKESTLCRPVVDNETELFLSRFNSADAVTRQTFTGSREKGAEIAAKFNAEIEDMEGAALHYVALMEHLPFFQLRAVSNEVGEKDRSKWNGPLALEAIKKAMLEYFYFECSR